MRARPLDLEAHSVLRTHLFIVHARRSVFLMTIHHIVADLWSLMLLLDELGVLVNLLPLRTTCDTM